MCWLPEFDQCDRSEHLQPGHFGHASDDASAAENLDFWDLYAQAREEPYVHWTDEITEHSDFGSIVEDKYAGVSTLGGTDKMADNAPKVHLPAWIRRLLKRLSPTI